MFKRNGIPIRPYTHKELTTLYHVSWPTLQRWLKPFEDLIGEKNDHFYNAKQIEIIFENLGAPDNDDSDYRKAS
jgi:hypothetical protein